MKMRLCALFSTVLLGSAIAAWAGSCNLPLLPTVTSGGQCTGFFIFKSCTADKVNDGGCTGAASSTRCRPLNASAAGNTYDPSSCHIADIIKGSLPVAVGTCVATPTSFGSFKGQTIPNSSCTATSDATSTTAQ